MAVRSEPVPGPQHHAGPDPRLCRADEMSRWEADLVGHGGEEGIRWGVGRVSSAA